MSFLMLAYVKYKDWKLHIGSGAGETYLQWQFKARCSKTGELCEQFGRKWRLSQWMTTSELITTAFKAALTAEEHECRENFKWKERRVFNPHIDVNELWEVCEREDVR